MKEQKPAKIPVHILLSVRRREALLAEARHQETSLTELIGRWADKLDAAQRRAIAAENRSKSKFDGGAQ